MTAKLGIAPTAARAAAVVVPILLAMTVTACSGGGGGTKAWCQSLQGGADPTELFAAGASSPEQMAAAIDRLRQLEAAAPDAIKGSLGDLVAVAVDIQKVLSDRAAGTTPPATVPPADTAKAEKASSAVVAYVQKTCAIQLGPPTSSGG